MKTCKRIGKRQGDVIICKSKIPADAFERNDRVIARGEGSGHAHVISAGDAKLFVAPPTTAKPEGGLYLKVYSDSAIVSHDTHPDVAFPKGEYEIGFERELDWYTGLSRKVAD